MASPFSTGGGGTHFECRVLAYYLAALLVEAPARGCEALSLLAVKTQQAPFGYPLDDIVISGAIQDGRYSKLHLQVKHKLSFTNSDDAWAATLKQAWKTFTGAFDPKTDRLGIAVAVGGLAIDEHYQTVIRWAVESASAEDFLARVNKESFSSTKMREFAATIRKVLEQSSGNKIDDFSFWNFVRCLRIVVFDFESSSSRDEENVKDRLRSYLPVQDRDRAADIWAHVIRQSAEIMPTGGGATRETIAEKLGLEGLPVGLLPSRAADIQAVERESGFALGSIHDSIGSLRVLRPKVSSELAQSVARGRFIQIVGEPGSGKSAMLKALALEQKLTGPTLVIASNRVRPRGWSAHASDLGIDTDLIGLLVELEAVGGPILFIDGIDRVQTPETKVTVNDLVRSIATEPRLSRWKIVVTVREQNLEHLRTWLDPNALKELPLETVRVPSLSEEEAAEVATAYPAVRAILGSYNETSAIARSPFFLNALIGLRGGLSKEPGPATEIELMTLWWKHGGVDAGEFAEIHARRDLILLLAERVSKNPHRSISIRGLPSSPLGELRSNGVLRDAVIGHSVLFAHDIYEEWSLCQYLVHLGSGVVPYVRSLGEPQALVRPVQLLGTSQLEFETEPSNWVALFREFGSQDLRPVWQRALLIGIVKSARAKHLLQNASTFLLADDSAELRRLLTALRTTETVPNERFLSESAVPDVSAEDRVRMAELAAYPKVHIWMGVFDWLFSSEVVADPKLIPELVSLFAVWQRAFAGRAIRWCADIGEIAFNWLLEFETALHPKEWDQRRSPFGVAFARDSVTKLERDIRNLFLDSAPNAPDLIATYLVDSLMSPKFPDLNERILDRSGSLAVHVPKILSSYLLGLAKSEVGNYGSSREDDELNDVFGLRSFYPASPRQPPFLIMLEWHETEGLKLIRDLCNIAIDRWLATRRRHASASNPLTPIAVKAKFSWGEAELWGDEHVYLWHRGTWGSNAVRCAFFALECWAHKKIESGAPFAEIFQKALEGHRSVAALGTGLSLCLAHTAHSASCAEALAGCAHLWRWDFHRLVEDSSGSFSNEIADWSQSLGLAGELKRLNRMPHRRTGIRDLAFLYLLSVDADRRDAFSARMRDFSVHPPFAYAEEAANEIDVQSLRNSMSRFADQMDPSRIRVEQTEDAAAFKIWIEPSDKQVADSALIVEEHKVLGAYIRLMLWARKGIDEREARPEPSLSDAYLEARSIDADNLFDTPANVTELLPFYRQNAVAGVAYMLARFGDANAWTEEASTWCFDVFRRACTLPAKVENFTSRGSILSCHPLVFAAHGYCALLNRNYEMDESYAALVDLAVDPLEEVSESVAFATRYFANSHPDIVWRIFRLFARMCVIEVGTKADSYTPHWDKEEADRALDLVREFERLTSVTLEVPQIPEPWVLRSDLPQHVLARSGGYVRNPVRFDMHLASKTILQIETKFLLHDASIRDEFVEYTSRLVNATLSEMSPPFSEPRRRRDHQAPFEWIAHFFSWLGKVAADLSESEIRRVILDPILAKENDTALAALAPFMRSYLVHALLPPQTLTPDRLRIWHVAAEWILGNQEARYSPDSHLSREFLECVYALLFCGQVSLRTLDCFIERQWDGLRFFVALLTKVVARFGTHRDLFFVVCVLLKNGGSDLLPDPGLAWLSNLSEARKSDREFWNLNGDELSEVLKIFCERDANRPDAQQRATIAKILDVLVDNGVRAAGFLQQELSRRSDRAPSSDAGGNLAGC
jgi:hypothetical protein